MRLCRNLTFITLIALLLTTAQEPLSASTLSDCPTGCDCTPQYLGPTQLVIEVDCWLVFECEETYPDFCDGFGTLESACDDLCNAFDGWHPDYWCYSSHLLDWWFNYTANCEDSGGCYGECACGHNSMAPCW